MTASEDALASSPGRIALKGTVISGPNPKVLLLYLSLFPQFIDSASGWPVVVQTGLLGTIHVTSCALVYLAVGVLARTVLKTRPSAARVVTRGSGAMMIAIGGAFWSAPVRLMHSPRTSSPTLMSGEGELRGRPHPAGTGEPRGAQAHPGQL
ncbi:LysE family translocator [Streptomyces decoyicus]